MSFDPHRFARNAGFGTFAALASAASAARGHAQACADVAATEEAVAEWEHWGMALARENASLRAENAALQAELARQQEQELLLVAELETARQRWREAGARR